MRRASLAVCVLVLALGCAGEAAQEWEISGLSTPPPETLQAHAASVRAAGGRVFLAEVDAVAAVTPERVPGPDDLFVEYPQGDAELTVVDALGETIDAEVTVRGSTDLPTVVDAEGAEASDWVISGASLEQWQTRLLPRSGAAVFFVVPGAAGAPERATWIAPVVDGQVLADGCVDETPVSPSALRR